MEENKSLRHNEGKLKWSLVHFKSLTPLVDVLMFGAKKYAPDNWKKGLDRKEILESMQRHLAALFDGEERDSESRLHHIGHIMCNCMFYSYHYVILQQDKKSHIETDEVSYLTAPISVIVENGVTKVKFLGQSEFQDGVEYNRYVDWFNKNKHFYSYKVIENSIVYTLKNK